MKTLIHLLGKKQLTATLKQLFGKFEGTGVTYSFQPLPAYWAMTPASRVMGIRTNNI